MSAKQTIEPMIERHEPHWVSKAALSVLTVLFFVAQAALGFAVYGGIYWLAVLLVLVSSHLMHGMLIGLHEASHGLLRKSRLLKEIDGIIIGVLWLHELQPLPSVHQSHHAHFATDRDEELWPGVQPRYHSPPESLPPLLELSVGLLYTPFLFIHAFLRTGSRNSKEKPARAHLG